MMGKNKIEGKWCIQIWKDEPAIVTKSTSLTNCRTSVEGIVLKKNKFSSPYTYSGKVIELKAVFK